MKPGGCFLAEENGLEIKEVCMAYVEGLTDAEMEQRLSNTRETIKLRLRLVFGKILTTMGDEV